MTTPLTVLRLRQKMGKEEPDLGKYMHEIEEEKKEQKPLSFICKCGSLMKVPNKYAALVKCSKCGHWGKPNREELFYGKRG